MQRRPTVVIDSDDRETLCEAWTDGSRLLLGAGALPGAVGWTRKPEGLCQGDVCLPTQLHPGLVTEHDGDELIDLAVLASATGRPAVIDPDAAIAAFGVPAHERAARLATLQAPDVTVTDLDGAEVSLADFRGRKKLLVAFASW